MASITQQGNFKVLQLTNIAAMTALNAKFDGQKVYVKGTTTANDGGGGYFSWDGSSVKTADARNTYASDAGGSGRWIRQNIAFDATAENIAELLTVPTGAKLTVNVLGFYIAGDGGGGRYRWDSTASKTTHNGGTIIDPDIGVAPGAAGWWTAPGSGVGVWKMVYSEEVNIRWFGAKLDGIDDTKSMKASLDACSIVHIPEGDCRLTSRVEGNSGNVIYGVGAKSIISVSDGVVGLSWDIPGARVSGANMIKHVIVRTLTLKGDSLTAGTTGIYLHNVTNALIEDIYFDKLDKVIHHGTLSGSTIRNVRNLNIEDSTTDCNYMVYSNTETRANDNTYRDCVARSEETTIYLGFTGTGYQDGTSIIDNILFTTGNANSDNIYIKGSLWSTITGNKLFGGARNGIRIEYVMTDSIIANNSIGWSGRLGGAGGAFAIHIEAASNSSVTSYGQSKINNNTISMPAGGGIYVKGVSPFTVCDNLITSCNNLTTDDTGNLQKFTCDAISIGAGSNRYYISDNYVDTGRHGQGGGGDYITDWRYDIHLASTVGLYGEVKHHTTNIKSEVKTIVWVGPRYKKAKSSQITDKSNKSPYDATSGWSQISGLTTTFTAESVTNPYGYGQDTVLQAVFPGGGNSGVRQGQVAPEDGGVLNVACKVRCVGSDVLRFWLSIYETGLTSNAREFTAIDEWREIFFQIENTSAAAFSVLDLYSVYAGTLQIAGLRVTRNDGWTDLGFMNYMGSTSPVTGFNHQGDQCINILAASGSPSGWVCTATGLPGAWLPMANLP